MRWRQVTTQERPWKMKRCSSRNTSRGRKGSSETGLKLGTVSTRVRPGPNYLGAKQWLRAVSVLCPTLPWRRPSPRQACWGQPVLSLFRPRCQRPCVGGLDRPWRVWVGSQACILSTPALVPITVPPARSLFNVS